MLPLAIHVPVEIAIQRVYASTFPVGEEGVVDFDRRFGRGDGDVDVGSLDKVRSAEAGVGLGNGAGAGKALGLWQAYRGCDWGTRWRVMRVYGVCWGMQSVVCVVGMGIVAGEVWGFGVVRG